MDNVQKTNHWIKYAYNSRWLRADLRFWNANFCLDKNGCRWWVNGIFKLRVHDASWLARVSLFK
jgi:hypothetical protein